MCECSSDLSSIFKNPTSCSKSLSKDGHLVKFVETPAPDFNFQNFSTEFDGKMTLPKQFLDSILIYCISRNVSDHSSGIISISRTGTPRFYSETGESCKIAIQKSRETNRSGRLANFPTRRWGCCLILPFRPIGLYRGCY